MGKKEITVKVEVPGIEASDFDISLDGRILTIKGLKCLENVVLNAAICYQPTEANALNNY